MTLTSLGRPPRPLSGDPGYWRFLVDAVDAEAITVAEADEMNGRHEFVAAALGLDASPADSMSAGRSTR